ncbi:MAG: hypothetical protein GY739_12235 [Mesoflavibacter sp.]|nr:hypothetical protein [Mesoflavibacter sp.]
MNDNKNTIIHKNETSSSSDENFDLLSLNSNSFNEILPQNTKDFEMNNDHSKASQQILISAENNENVLHILTSDIQNDNNNIILSDVASEISIKKDAQGLELSLRDNISNKDENHLSAEVESKKGQNLEAISSCNDSLPYIKDNEVLNIVKSTLTVSHSIPKESSLTNYSSDVSTVKSISDYTDFDTCVKSKLKKVLTEEKLEIDNNLPPKDVLDLMDNNNKNETSCSNALHDADLISIAESDDTFVTCFSEIIGEKVIAQGVIHVEEKRETYPVDEGKMFLFNKYFKSFSNSEIEQVEYPFILMAEDINDKASSYCTDTTISDFREGKSYFNPQAIMTIENKYFDNNSLEEKIINLKDFLLHPIIILMAIIQKNPSTFKMAMLHLIIMSLSFQVYFWVILGTSWRWLTTIKLGHRFRESHRKKGKNKFKEKDMARAYTQAELENTLQEIRKINCDLSIEDKITIPFSLNNIGVIGELDSGSGINLISHSILKQAYPNYKNFRRTELYKLFNVSKQRIPIVCARMIPMHIRGIGYVEMPFHVAYRSGICLLGRQFMRESNVELKVRGSKVSISLSLDPCDSNYKANTISNVNKIELSPNIEQEIEYDTTDLSPLNHEYFMFRNNSNFNIISYKVIKYSKDKIIITVKNDGDSVLTLEPGESIISCIPWEPTSKAQEEMDLQTLSNFEHNNRKGLNIVQTIDLKYHELKKYTLFRKIQFLLEDLDLCSNILKSVDKIIDNLFDVPCFLSSIIEYFVKIKRFYDINQMKKVLDKHLKETNLSDELNSPF